MHSTSDNYTLISKTVSVSSVDPVTKIDSHDHIKILNSTNKLNFNETNEDSHNMEKNIGPCSLAHMLLTYAHQDMNAITNPGSANSILNSTLNILEVYFNSYASDKRQIYIEGIFQILYDFKEQITESMLIETMYSLQV